MQEKNLRLLKLGTQGVLRIFQNNLNHLATLVDRTTRG